MVRVAQSLYLLSNSLKLSLLLSQSQMSDVRNSEADQLLRDTETYKRECSQLLTKHWLSGSALHEDPAPGAEPSS